jgi:hypothetical protein
MDFCDFHASGLPDAMNSLSPSILISPLSITGAGLVSSVVPVTTAPSCVIVQAPSYQLASGEA